MNDLLSAPLWLVALVAAAAAPGCVHLVATQIERRAKERTRETVARADAMGSADFESVELAGGGEGVERNGG